jgi:hypothetical protein
MGRSVRRFATALIATDAQGNIRAMGVSIGEKAPEVVVTYIEVFD